ncbi:MAG: hypothetical protein JW918_01085 [Anaerolineae bacterium]|nr:hypothetical protein [Anaerolineae bacterium]
MIKRKMLIVGMIVLVLLLGTGYVLAQTAQPAVPLAVDTATMADAASVPQPTGGFADGGDFLVSAEGLDEAGAAITWNEDDDEYLVVWYTLDEDFFGATQMYIRGRIYSAQGVPQGEPFDISTGDDRRFDASVAYSPAAGEYLVVWFDDETDQVRGQRVGADGSLLDNASTSEDEADPGVSFAVSPSDELGRDPSVAYNPVTDEYLVAWEGTDSGTGRKEIRGQLVDADGFLLGGMIDIATPYNSGWRGYPDVAYNGVRDEYLVVWGGNEGVHGGTHVYGQRVDADGTLLDNPGTPEDESHPTTGFIVYTGTLVTNDVAVAHHAQADEYLVLWTHSQYLRGRVVDGNGDLLDVADTPEDESDPAVDFFVASKLGQITSSDVVYNPTVRQYLVVWADDRNSGYESIYDIYGLRMGAGGVKAPQGEFAISRAADDQMRPAVAYSTDSNQYLVVWNDKRNNGEDGEVYGQRVWWPGLLLGHNFGITSASLSQTYPAVAYNHRYHEYLAVWADERNGNADIYGQRYDRDGIPLGSNFVIRQEAGDQLYPDVAYNSIDNEYLVVWSDSDDDTVEWRRLSALGTGLDSGRVYTGVGKQACPAVAYNSNVSHGDYIVVFDMQEAGGTYKVLAAHLDAEGNVAPVYYSASSSASNLAYPDIVYNDITNEYMVVWQNLAGNQGDIWGRRVDPIGVQVGAEFVIGQAADTQGFPAIAWNDNANEYLVVWYDYRTEATTGTDIYGRRVGAASNVLGSDFIISSAAGATDQLHPAVIYVQSADRYRVVWDDDRDSASKGTGYDIRGRWVTSAGAVVGTFDDIIIRQIGWQRYPAIVYSEAFDRALTVWHDGRSGVEYDVYGTFSALDTEAPTARFTVDDRWGEEGDEFVFNAWPSTDAPGGTPRGELMVRWDLNSDGTWETEYSFQKYITRTVNTAGIYTITLEVRDFAWYTDTISYPIVVLPAGTPDMAPGAQLAVTAQPTATLTISPTYGVAGTSFAFDASGSAGDGNITARWDWENDGEFDTAFDTVLTATHVYTVAGDYTARVEVYDDSSGLSHAALGNITVLAGTPVSLTVLPKPVDAVGGEQVDFRATGWDVYGNKILDPAVTWSVTDSAAGDIDSTGVFTAGLQVGIYEDVVLAQSGVVSDTASVTVFWPQQVYLPLVIRDP